jgi:hypothetical protein
LAKTVVLLASLALAATLVAGAPGTSAAEHSVAAATGHTVESSASTLPLPGDASSADASPQIHATACPSSRSCISVGSYQLSQDKPAGLIEMQTSAGWRALRAPEPPNVATDNRLDVLNAIACPSLGSCVVTGTYRAKHEDGHFETLIETLSGGTWSVQQLPEPPAPHSGSDAQISALSCPTITSCVAVGQYYPSGGGSHIGLNASLTDGVWQSAPAPQAAGQTFSELAAVSCSSPSFCMGFGQTDTGGDVEVLDGSAGWATVALPLPANAYVRGDTGYTSATPWSLSCPADGTCVVVGSYTVETTDDTLATEGLIDRLSGGAWSSLEAPTPPEFAKDADSTVLHVSCPTVSWCEAGPIGGFTNSDGKFVDAFDRFSNGAWTVDLAPGPTDVPNPSVGFDYGLLTCLAPGACRTFNTDSAPYAGELAAGRWSVSLLPLPDDAGSAADAQSATLACVTVTTCVMNYAYRNNNGVWSAAAARTTGSETASHLVLAQDRPNGYIASDLQDRRRLTNPISLKGPASAHLVTTVIPARLGTAGTPLFVETRRNARLYWRTTRTSWHLLAAKARCVGPPAALTIGDTLYVACERPNHALGVLNAALSATGPSSSGVWLSLHGYLTAPPAIAFSGQAVTYFVNIGRRVESRTASTAYRSIGAGCVGPVAAASAIDRVSSYVACRTATGSIRMWSDDGAGWSKRASLGGRAISSPAIAATNTGPVVVAEFADHKTWVRFDSRWSRLVGRTSSEVSAAGLN